MPMRIVASGIQKMYCEECDVVVDPGEGEAVYECGACGTEFSRSNSADGDSARCPDCNRFAGKTSDDGHECGSVLVTMAQVEDAPEAPSPTAGTA